MSRPPRVKYLKMKDTKRLGIGLDRYPSFSASGSVTGMRKLYYGNDAYLVRCGAYIYKVPGEIYDRVPG